MCAQNILKPMRYGLFSCLDDHLVGLDLFLELDVFSFELQVGDGVLWYAVRIPAADIAWGNLKDTGKFGACELGLG